MTVHESVMEIQIWIIIFGNWNMNLYELPMISSNSYPVTSFVEWWNLSLYKEKTIHNLTKQINCSNFESLIYGLIVRFSISIILKIQYSKYLVSASIMDQYYTGWRRFHSNVRYRHMTVTSVFVFFISARLIEHVIHTHDRYEMYTGEW